MYRRIGSISRLNQSLAADCAELMQVCSCATLFLVNASCKSRFGLWIIAGALIFYSGLIRGAEPTLPSETRQRIDDAAKAILSATGAPGASVAIVQDGRIAYLQAYGAGRLKPRLPAIPAM